MIQKTQQNYNNGDCVHKRSCRYILEGELNRLGLNELHAVTLPNLNFELEKSLWSKYKNIDLQTCEINEETYRKQIALINHKTFEGAGTLDKRLVLHHGNVFELKTDSPLNFVWLDLCGYLTEKTLSGICQFAFDNEFRPDGVFAVTLQIARENSSTIQFFKKLQKDVLNTYFTDLKNFKNVQLPKILCKLIKEHTGRNLEISAKYRYKPSSGGAPMCMYGFTWRNPRKND